MTIEMTVKSGSGEDLAGLVWCKNVDNEERSSDIMCTPFHTFPTVIVLERALYAQVPTVKAVKIFCL